jgi:hypothetical protein
MKRNAYRILVGKPEETTKKTKSRWVDNIKMDLEKRCSMDWIDLAQDRGQRRALGKTAMNLWVS